MKYGLIDLIVWVVIVGCLAAVFALALAVPTMIEARNNQVKEFTKKCTAAGGQTLYLYRSDLLCVPPNLLIKIQET